MLFCLILIAGGVEKAQGCNDIPSGKDMTWLQRASSSLHRRSDGALGDERDVLRSNFQREAYYMMHFPGDQRSTFTIF